MNNITTEELLLIYIFEKNTLKKGIINVCKNFKELGLYTTLMVINDLIEQYQKNNELPITKKTQKLFYMNCVTIINDYSLFNCNLLLKEAILNLLSENFYWLNKK